MCSGTYSLGSATSASGNSGKSRSIGWLIELIMGPGPQRERRAGGWHDPAAMVQPGLAQRLLAGDRRALARAITLVEDGDPAGAELVREVYPHTGRAAIVGFTGPPGAGKSTLIASLVARRRQLGRQIGVLSVDPSSPFSGGALLGDRIR